MTKTPRTLDGRAQQAALDAHVGAENLHDVDAIMDTFSADAVLELNGVGYDTPEAIRGFHEAFGFGEKGALTDLQIVESRRSFTDDGIVVEGTVRGRHTGPMGPLAPTGKDVAMPYCVIYQFDDAGKLYSERAYVDTTALLG